MLGKWVRIIIDIFILLFSLLKKRVATVARMLTVRDHVEVMRGTIDEARAYCIKSGPA